MTTPAPHPTPGVFLLDDLEDLLAADEDAALDLDASVSEWAGGER